jgi:hypothetical protein
MNSAALAGPQDASNGKSTDAQHGGTFRLFNAASLVVFFAAQMRRRFCFCRLSYNGPGLPNPKSWARRLRKQTA